MIKVECPNLNSLWSKMSFYFFKIIFFFFKLIFLSFFLLSDFATDEIPVQFQSFPSRNRSSRHHQNNDQSKSKYHQDKCWCHLIQLMAINSFRMNKTIRIWKALSLYVPSCSWIQWSKSDQPLFSKLLLKGWTFNFQNCQKMNYIQSKLARSGIFRK